jgi:hypothetical protein
VHCEEWPDQAGAEVDQHHEAAQPQDAPACAGAAGVCRCSVVRGRHGHDAAALDEPRAHRHLREVAGGHQADASGRAEVLQREAAGHGAGDAAQVDHHRQQADDVAMGVGGLHAHQVRVHEQVAALAHEHRHRQHPIPEHAVGEPAQQAQRAGGRLREQQQVHRLDAPRNPCPQRQRAHHGDRYRGDVGTNVESARYAIAALEEVRIERDQDRIAHHGERRHRDDGRAQAFHAATSTNGPPGRGANSCSAVRVSMG